MAASNLRNTVLWIVSEEETHLPPWFQFASMRIFHNLLTALPRYCVNKQNWHQQIAAPRRIT